MHLPTPQTQHADPELVQIMQGYFQHKSAHEVDATMAYISRNLTTYADATLGWDLAGFDALKNVFAQYMPNWPESGLSYATTILGSAESAVIAVTDTPELFGGELRVLAAVDLVGGQVVRWVDYWDGATFDDALYAQLRTPAEQFPTEFREAQLPSRAAPELVAAATALQQAFSSGNPEAAAALLSNDVVYEDMPLRAQVLGRAGVTRYLGRVLGEAPHGAGSRLRRVIGGAKGGGFEWIAAPDAGAPWGLTALELDDGGRISRITTVYDSKGMDPAKKDRLVLAALDR